MTKPVELASPADTVEALLSSPFYHPAAVLALYTWTDAFATPANRRHLRTLLSELSTAGVTNPVTVLTKCYLEDEDLDALDRYRHAGHPLAVYLSLSGLDCDIERGIDAQRTRMNFPRLRDRGMPLVHYWRPALPQNSTLNGWNQCSALPHSTRTAR